MKDSNAKPKGKLYASIRVLAVAAVLAACSSLPSWAAEQAQPPADLPQVVTEASAPAGLPVLKETTHPTIHLSPDDTHLIKLDKDAGLVVVGNPEHANVIADSTRTLVVIPRNPGATYFTVMAANGEILMRRMVIIAGPEQHYVRVKNTCRSGGSKSCNENNIYYCPDTCHKILLGTEEVSVDDKDVPGGGGGEEETAAKAPAPEEKAAADAAADEEAAQQGTEE